MFRKSNLNVKELFITYFLLTTFFEFYKLQKEQNLRRILYESIRIWRW